MLAVLDTMMERLEDQYDTFVVHYSVLDGDREGRPPNDPHFSKAHKSCLHKIAKSNNKVGFCRVLCVEEIHPVSISIKCPIIAYYRSCQPCCGHLLGCECLVA